MAFSRHFLLFFALTLLLAACEASQPVPLSPAELRIDRSVLFGEIDVVSVCAPPASYVDIDGEVRSPPPDASVFVFEIDITGFGKDEMPTAAGEVSTDVFEAAPRDLGQRVRAVTMNVGTELGLVTQAGLPNSEEFALLTASTFVPARPPDDGAALTESCPAAAAATLWPLRLHMQQFTRWALAPDRACHEQFAYLTGGLDLRRSRCFTRAEVEEFIVRASDNPG